MKIKYVVEIVQKPVKDQVVTVRETFDTEAEAERYASINRMYPHEGRVIKQVTTEEVVREWIKTRL